MKVIKRQNKIVGRVFFGTYALLFCVSCGVYAATDDVLVSYRTVGPDCYADGTTVLDGECYALVCTKGSAPFGGFTAAGTVAQPANDELAVVAPAALDGHCRRVVFALPKAYVAAHRTDTWTVQLLDTRSAVGRPVGLVDGVLGRVNGSGEVDGQITFGDAGAVAFAAPQTSARVSVASAVPPELVPQPVITGLSVADGRVVLSVEGTVPFVTYDLAGAETPEGLAAGAPHVATRKRDGSADGTLTLEAEADARARFFKVVRAE